MAYFDNSGFVGVSLDDIFGTGLECSQLSKQTRGVAVLETDDKTLFETDGKAVLEKVCKTNRGQDGKPVCGVDLETVRETNLDILRETDPKTGAERNRE